MGKKVDIEQEATRLVMQEITQWEDATAFVTDKVAFMMRPLIRTFRKNYWGIFDSPNDPTTGRKKVWVPLIETMVENVVKSIDLDQKDIRFRAKRPAGIASTQVVRAIVKEYLDSIFFGEMVNEMERQLAIDGTVVWKTYEQNGELVTKPVDLLNCYIDPTAENIQDALRFTERSLMTAEEIANMDGWMNTDDVLPMANRPWTDQQQLQGTQAGSAPQSAETVDVYEMWGWIPKSLFTGDPDDEKKQTQGRIVASGLDAGGTPVLHILEKNKHKDGLKPYEEIRYAKVSGRWYGKGISEKLLMLQLYINTIVNIRINRSYVAQLGLFKIRKGAGITPQMISRLGANGAVVVSSMDDLEQLVMKEASQASYADERNIIDWAQRLTSAFEVITGEGLPASTPATNAILQDRNARSQFALVQEGVGMFFQRWMDRHALPILIKRIKADDLVRLVGDDEGIRGLIEKFVASEAAKELDNFELLLKQTNLDSVDRFNGAIREVERAQRLVRSAEDKLRNSPELFVQMFEKIALEDLDTKVKVFVTNEEMDVAVTVQNLINMMQVAPEFREQIVRQAMDIMGIDAPQINPRQQVQALPSPEQLPQQNDQQIRTEATVPQNTGVGQV